MSANEGGLEKETDLNNEDELKHKGSVLERYINLPDFQALMVLKMHSCIMSLLAFLVCNLTRLT